MKKLTWALLSLMLFLGLGTAFAQNDDFGGGGGGGDLTISVPTLKPASGVVKPGATIDAAFANEMVEQIGPMGSLMCICVLYVENDEATELETSMEELGPFMNLLTAEEDEEIELPSAAYKVAVYSMNNDEDFEPDDPDDPAGWMKWYAPIAISKDADGDAKLRLRVAAVTMSYEIKYSEVFTADYTTTPQLSLSPITTDGAVGKGVMSSFSIDGGLVNPWSGESMAVEMMYPVAVYYTTDGTTVPSKDAYEAQTDKENGAIKKVESEMEDGDLVYPDNGKFLPVALDEACTLKAIGYYTTDDDEDVVTALFDKQITVKVADNPVLDPADATAFMVGNKLVIKNPDPAPGEDDEDYFDYDEDHGTCLYISFDGTKPTPDAYDQLEWNDYSIIKAKAGKDVEIFFRQDAKGLYVYMPEILGYNSPADYVRIENGKLSLQVMCQSYMATGREIEHMVWGKIPEMMAYGSDIIAKEYTVEGLVLPETVTAPTFVPDPTAGALGKGDAIKFEMDAAYEKFSERDNLVAVAYVVNGTDADLDIDAAKLDALMADYAMGYSAGVREDGKVYLYAEETDAFEINQTMEVKARQIVTLSFEAEEGEDADVQIALSSIVTANYTVDASKLAKPTIKTPIAGSTVEPNSPITFEMPAEYDWTAYTDLAYILYVENNDEVALEGTAEDIMNAVPQNPVAPTAKEGELAYKVVNCHKDGDDLEWTKALIATQEGTLKIRARLAGINLQDEVFYSDEVTVTCTVKKSEGPGDDPENPGLPETVKTPTFVPAAGEVEKGQAITWTWDADYNEETYPLIAVAYVVNGDDADLDITVENFGELWEASQDEDENTVREEGVTYLYRTDVDDAYPYHIEKASTVKARMLLGIVDDETGAPAIALSAIVEAAYTIKGETPAVEVAKPTFSVKAGAVEAGTKVEIACETEGAVIYYTIDGTEPTEKSTEYKEAIEIKGKVTIKAIAVKGDAKSEVAEATYELLANEDLELAGVSVYPNPSNGMFNLELPVAATVEVFMSNGMLYQRLTLGEGNATLNIERSGIYFLRITGEGRTTVKRVIVR